jgi:hypothetical protein
VSVIPIDFYRRPGVWHDLAHSLARRVDNLAAYAVRRAVSESALRRTDTDIRRARELMTRRERPRNVNLARLRVAPFAAWSSHEQAR